MKKIGTSYPMEKRSESISFMKNDAVLVRERIQKLTEELASLEDSFIIRD